MINKEKTKKIIQHLGAIASIGISQLSFASSPKFELPRKPNQQLAVDFPKAVCDVAKDLSSFRKCRVELDIFLNTSLEPYNEEIQAYREKLNELSRAIEQSRRKGELSQASYTELNSKIGRELEDTSRHGASMRLYFVYLERFRKIAKWVVEEIRLIERQQLQIRAKSK